MIATVLLGVCLAAAGPDESPKPGVAHELSRRDALAGSGGDARRSRVPEDDAAGKTAGRPEHPGPAPKGGPGDVTARGLLGLVRYHGEWLEPDAVAARVSADADQAAALDEYHVRRGRTPHTAVAQMELANWCERHGLRAEAIAHLTAVTRLDPDHSSAWRRLGCRPFHGRWMTEAQYAAEEQKKADRHWDPHLAALARRLDGSDPERGTAERELADVTDPRAVPAVWRTFVTGKPARLDLAVRLLGQIDSPESSRRLVALIGADQRGALREKIEREAQSLDLAFAAEGLRQLDARLAAERQVVALTGVDPRGASREGLVRDVHLLNQLFASEGLQQLDARLAAEPLTGAGQQALTILRHRDPRDFLGAMIDSLQAPVTVGVQKGRDLSGVYEAGTLRVESETLHLRRTYVFARVRTNVPIPKRGVVVGRDINRDYQQALNYQASIDRKNREVSLALHELTGQVIDEPDPVRAREAWKAWWADEQGYPYTPGVPRRKRTVDQVASAVIYVRAHSCFAAGTPVRTLLGPRPIESIQVGDQVLSHDVTTGALGFEPVLALHHNPPKPTLRIDLGDEALVATPIHRFWKAGRGWAMARDLRPGDTIRRLGGTARVVSVSEDKVQPVFNLDVARSRSFFVGSSGALVHDNSLVDPVLRPFDASQVPPAASAGAR